MNRPDKRDRHPTDEFIERCREISEGTGITTEDVLEAIEADRAEHAIRVERIAFGCLRGELAYEDGDFDADPDIQEMFYGEH